MIFCGEYMTKKKIPVFIVLHILLMVYSLSGVCSKMAGKAEFLSLDFILWYGAMLFIMVIYAFGWQQILKRLPLSIAFANKAVTLVWSIVFGVLVFNETLKITQIIGCVLAVIGVLIFIKPSKEEQSNDK